MRFIMVLALAALLLLGGCGSKTQEQKTPAVGSDRKVVQEQKEQKAEPFQWAGANVTEENVNAALAEKAPANPISKDRDFPKNLTQIKIIDNAAKQGQKNLQVYFKASTPWDETDFVKCVGGTAIAAGSILFANPKVEELALFAQTDMTDQYGKKATENAIKIVLNRDLANKVDWKGLADRHSTDPGNIYRIASNYYIHPGVLKNVKRDKVRLH